MVTRVHSALAVLGATVLPIDASTPLEVSIDESRQPAISVKLPSHGVSWNADPRSSTASGDLDLTLSERQVGASAPLTTIALRRLSMRTADKAHTTGDVPFEFASREAAIQQKAYTGAPGIGPSTWAGVAEACDDVLRTYCGEPLTYANLVGTTGAGISPTLVQGVTARTGDAWWPLVSDLAQRTGRHLYVAPSGAWVLGPSDPTLVGHYGTLSLRMESCVETITRDSSPSGQWGDAVIVRYQWTAGGTDHLIIGAAGVANPESVVTIDERVEATQAQADARAAALLTRASRRAGRTWNIVALSRYDIEPRRRYSWTPPRETDPVTVYVASVAWSLPSATMRLTLWEV